MMQVCPIKSTSAVNDDKYDCVVLVTDTVDKLTGSLASLRPVVTDYLQVCYSA